MADPPQDIDTEELAEAVVEQLDPGSVIDDKVVLSRRQLLALTGGGASLAALGFGTDSVAAADGTNDTSVGDVGAAGDSVDVFVDELRDDGGDEWLDVDDTGDINAAFGRTWNYDSISTDDLDVGGTDFVASGDVHPLAFFDGGGRSASTTSTTFVTSRDLLSARLQWLQFIDNTDDLVAIMMVNPNIGSGETYDIRVQNRTSSETVISETDVPDGRFSTGWRGYAPSSPNATEDVVFEHRTNPGSNSSSTFDLVFGLGVQL